MLRTPPPYLLVILLGLCCRAGIAEPSPALPSTVLDVTTFGAVGDGKADDTAAIQKAIDAAWYTDTEGNRQPGGIVYLPPGQYRTTAPLRLHTYVVLMGDEGQVRGNPRGAWIESEADAALVAWQGDWPEGQEIEAATGIGRLSERGLSAVGVVIKNIAARGRKFGFHSMGCAIHYLRVENCRLEGGVAAFVSTGDMYFSRIDTIALQGGLWITPDDGSARFNTTEISNVLIGLYGNPGVDWAIRLEGCIQCVTIRNITLEAQPKGILLDAKYAGVNIAIDGVWSYDINQPNEVIRVKAGDAIRLSNVYNTDQAGALHIEGGSKVVLESVLTGTIDLHGSTSTTVIGCLSSVVNAGPGCVIEGEKIK